MFPYPLIVPAFILDGGDLVATLTGNDRNRVTVTRAPFRRYPIATMRSIGSLARSAISGGTLTS